MREIIIRGDDALDKVTYYHNAGRGIIIEEHRVLTEYLKENN